MNVFAGEHHAAAIGMFNLFNEDIPVTLASNTGLRIGTDGQFLINTGTSIVPDSGGQELDGFRIFQTSLDSSICYRKDGEFRLSFDDALEFAFVEYAKMLAAEATENMVLERGHFSH